MADPQGYTSYTIPPLTYVDPAHILLFGTSGDAGVNVLADALVARRSDGQFYATRNWAGATILNVINGNTGSGVYARLGLATGSANRYAIMQIDDAGAYRQTANGSGLPYAYDDSDNHVFRRTDGTQKLILQSDLTARLSGGTMLVGYDKLLLQHDGSNGYIRAETGSLILGTVAANRWIINATAFFPTSDNTYSLAWSANRASVVFSATGTINTSDEREKDWRGKLVDAELRAARRIAGEIGVYRWLDAVAAKGDKARIHIGARAQRVWAIMAEEGLVDPIDADGRPGQTPYAMLCWDEWPDQWEDEYEDVTVIDRVLAGEKVSTILGADGQSIREPVFEERERIERRPTGNKVLVTPAGNRFGLRVDQLCLFLAAAQEQRLAALESAA